MTEPVLYSSRLLSGTTFRIKGNVNGEDVTLITDLGTTSPTVQQCLDALDRQDSRRGAAMKAAVHSARPIGGGRYRVKGIAAGELREVVFTHEGEGEPTMDDCTAALERGVSEPGTPPNVTQMPTREQRELREPATPGGPREPGDNTPPASAPASVAPEVAALIEGNVAAVTARVAECADEALLGAAYQAEAAEKNRSTALAAILDRAVELQGARIRALHESVAAGNATYEALADDDLVEVANYEGVLDGEEAVVAALEELGNAEIREESRAALIAAVTMKLEAASQA